MPTESLIAPQPEPSLGCVRDGLHSTCFRIYMEDTDQAGIVYHARYLHFFERARTQILALAGYRQQELMAHREDWIGFSIRRVEIDYRAPAHLDDIVTVETRIARLGGASMDFDQRMVREHVPLAVGTVSVACVGATGKPRRMPGGIMQDLARLMTGEEDEVNARE